MNTLLVWTRLATHAGKLTFRALARSWPWLFVAPAVGFALELLSAPIERFAGGMLGGFVIGFLAAVALSVLVYVGRGIIEQRRLQIGELFDGMQAFLGEVMNVLFVLWIAEEVLSHTVPMLLLALGLGLVVVPLLETVALAATSGFSAFGSAWEFFRRDWAPWLVGQLPLVALYAGWSVLEALVVGPLSLRAGGFVAEYADAAFGALGTALLFAAFIYRGVLYLTLDNVAPHARASRFGAKSRSAA